MKPAEFVLCAARLVLGGTHWSLTRFESWSRLALSLLTNAAPAS